MKYCRHCGKSIDIDSSYCTYCGKNQGIQDKSIYNGDIRKAFSKFIEIIICFLQRAFVKLRTSNINYDSKACKNIQIWGQRILILILVLVVVGLIVLFGFWIYGFYITSKWEKEDEHRVVIALKDISKADSIARVFFEEYNNNSHWYAFNDSDCEFNHIESGFKIVRNAAEQGDPKAQFTLGRIYNGVADDDLRCVLNHRSEIHCRIDLTRAAFWYNQAAKQGNTNAMSHLANLYRKGYPGVKKDLFKATELMKSAAEKGCALAQLNYGDMFRDGEVMIKSESNSDALAQLNYGYRFRDGEVIMHAESGSDERNYIIIRAKPNITKALEWWQKALENGENSAKERLEKIYE